MLTNIEIVHSRVVFDTLMLLANIGGVQLILTIVFQTLTNSLNEKKSYLSVIKKFFVIKTSVPDAFPVELNNVDKDLY